METSILQDIPLLSSQQVNHLNQALVHALATGSNKPIKAVRCQLKSIADNDAACKSFSTQLQACVLSDCKTIEARLHVLYIINDLLHWSGQAPPVPLLAALKSALLQPLRAVYHAPGVATEMQQQVMALLDLWQERKSLASMTLVGLRAGLAIRPKDEHQYAFCSARKVSRTLSGSRVQEQQQPPTVLTLGTVDQPYWQLPASLLLDGLPSTHERKAHPSQSLIPVCTARCVGGQRFTITADLVAAADALINQQSVAARFPELEEEEPSQAAYEGWQTLAFEHD